MTWWSYQIVTEVSGDPSTSTGGYVNEDQVSALVPTSFYETSNSRSVWYVAIIGESIPADAYLPTSGFLSVTDARAAAQDWCGGRNA